MLQVLARVRVPDTSLLWLVKAGMTKLRTLGRCLCTALTAGILALGSFAGEAVSQTRDVQLGAYDPHGTFRDDPSIRIEHVYLPWQDVDLVTLTTAANYARQRKRLLLITIEPWSWSPEAQVAPGQLLQAILSGRHDRTIAAICSKAAELPTTTTIRWAHEMDLAENRYTWSYWTPSQYIAAYRYFVGKCRASGDKLQFMWSPRGEVNLHAYYPGDDVVDVVGLSLFALQQFDRDKFGRDRTLAEQFRPSYDRVLRYKKNIIIAEFGCDGNERYLENCRVEVNSNWSGFPQLQSVIYFNEVESHPWPAPYGLPNWRVRKPATN